MHAGGRVEVCGGYLRNYQLRGRFALCGNADAEGVLAIHSGTCLVNNTSIGGGLWVGSGGKVEMDGGLLDLYLYTDGYSPLTLAGGTMDIGGDALVRIGNGLGLYFGNGNANFFGNAKLIYDRTSGRLAISPRAAFDVTRLDFSGSSSLSLDGAIATYVGYDGPIGSKAILRHMSSATSHAGSICVVGEYDGFGEIDIENGQFICGSYGLFLGATTYSNAPEDGVMPEGIVKVSGGILSVNGSQSNAARLNRIFGLAVGDGTVVANGAASASFHKGRLEVSGGVVSNLAGFVSVGIGKANGVVWQTGGDFISVANGRATTIGSFGGYGEWMLNGGTASVLGDIYIGGCTTSDWKRSSSYPIFGVESGSQGRLNISNGSFAVGGNAYVGKNGTGLLELGTGGVFSVASSLNMQRGGTLKFVFGPSGTGTVNVDDSFAVDENAKLVVDLSAYGDDSGRHVLVRTKGNLGHFNEANVEIVGKQDSQRCVLEYRNKALSCSIGRGFTMIVR